MSNANHDGASRWRPVDALVEGDHVHLDALIDVAPEPGSPDWLPVVDELARYLVDTSGRWLIALRLGNCDGVPTGAVDVQRAFDIADAGELMEPPAVYRLHDANLPNRWAGESHRWTRAVSAEITEEIAVTRSVTERATDERFSVVLNYEI